MDRSIMVAVDGSINSCYVVDYICLTMAGISDLNIQLFSHGGSFKTPECSDIDTLFSPPDSSDEDGKKNVSLQHIERARTKLLNHGFSASQIVLKVDQSNKPIAKSILQRGIEGNFDGVVVGRRGWGALSDIFLGSVSLEVFNQSHKTPIWIINGNIKSNKFFVPVDGSVNSLLAVDHLAYMIHDSPTIEINLFHSSPLFSTEKKRNNQDFYKYWDKAWCVEHIENKDKDRFFSAPKQLLKEVGFPEERVHIISPSLHIETSSNILGQAAAHDCGTIVIGRRGAEVPKDIFRRVSNRLVTMAENVAIWVVG